MSSKGEANIEYYYKRMAQFPLIQKIIQILFVGFPQT